MIQQTQAYRAHYDKNSSPFFSLVCLTRRWASSLIQDVSRQIAAIDLDDFVLKLVAAAVLAFVGLFG